MGIALIFAGGAGNRMNTRTLPKQFLELHGKPILVYTLEHFQKHMAIDGIVIACLKDYLEYCESIVLRFHLTKVVAIVPGGETGQQSICRGLETAREHYPDDTVVLVHDGVRPLIDGQTISDVIACVQQHGSAITVSPLVETITVREDDREIRQILDRSQCQLAKAPQAFYLGELWSAHQQAIRDGKHDFTDSASLMRYYGHSLYAVNGPAENIKITTPTDFYIFRALLDARENSQIFG